MKATVVGLVSPHVLAIVDLARQAEGGVNVDWHLRDAVSRTMDELSQHYNARDLMGAYLQGLDAAAQEAGRPRLVYVAALRSAAAIAAGDPRLRD